MSSVDLKRADLWSLEQYSTERPEFKEKVLAHKKNRHVALGKHLHLTFEDRLTIQYQVQEMLRIEKIFEASGIQEELDAYNPLIPDGDNWKATLLIEYQDAEERKLRLAELVGVENRLWVKVGTHEPVFAIADEDMERSNEEKTSAVHFLRFQFAPDVLAAVRQGDPITVGVEHEKYPCEPVVLSETIKTTLSRDFS